MTNRVMVEFICDAEKQGALLFGADLLRFVRCFEIQGESPEFGETVGCAESALHIECAVGMATRSGRCTAGLRPHMVLSRTRRASLPSALTMFNLPMAIVLCGVVCSAGEQSHVARLDFLVDQLLKQGRVVFGGCPVAGAVLEAAQVKV